MTYDVIVIGGGLAGSSAAIHLAERGRHVLLLERRTLPAGKLCGEFLSPEVALSLERLGLLRAVRAAGAHPIRRALLTTAGGATYAGRLPGTALGLSRYRLDKMLFDRAAAAGADTCDGATVRAVDGSLADGFEVSTGGTSYAGRVVLGAYGRRSLLDRKLERAFIGQKNPYVAFKAHFAGDGVADRVEVHAFRGGYCGLSHVEEGRVNVCWIARKQRLAEAGGRPEAMMEHVLAENPVLGHRLRRMRRVSERFEAVAQVSLAPKPAFEQGVCMVGDAAGMIAPLCGDGMAMALRSAELAVPHAAEFLSGEAGAEDFRARYARDRQRAFALRMRLGRWIQRASMRPAWSDAVVRTCRWVPGLGPWLIRQTRG